MFATRIVSSTYLIVKYFRKYTFWVGIKKHWKKNFTLPNFFQDVNFIHVAVIVFNLARYLFKDWIFFGYHHGYHWDLDSYPTISKAFFKSIKQINGFSVNRFVAKFDQYFWSFCFASIVYFSINSLREIFRTWLIRFTNLDVHRI